MRARSLGSGAIVPVTSVEITGRNYRYDALIGAGLLDQIGTRLLDLRPGPIDRLNRSILPNRSGPGRCAIISDARVAPIFAERLIGSLTSAGFEPSLVIVPPGEESKSLAQVEAICDEMIEQGLDRHSFVIGLGGGVIGDISGFVAAIFQRGVPQVQIPTTLLAMVDSSIGGKCGVNTRAGKNLLGAIHQPALVIADVDLLQTLPPHELRQGFAEIIKHAIIADAEMFADLARTTARLDWLNQSSLTALVRRNVEIKAGIVAQDERDRTGARAILNFGHTIGHAIERAGDYKKLPHGDAISLGMIAAANISMKCAGLPKEERDSIVDLFGRFELPTRLPNEFSREQIFEAVKTDKKFESGAVRFVVTPKIGCAVLSRDVTLEDIREAIEEL